jgi:hypothetical protein
VTIYFKLIFSVSFGMGRKFERNFSKERIIHLRVDVLEKG